MNSEVDFYFNKGRWQDELKQLRMTILDCGLTEELKWGVPCYTYPSRSSGRGLKKSNIVLIHVFKEYCALLFFKGALLRDTEHILIRQTENVQMARQIRFTGVGEIVELDLILKSYIYEAIEVERAGLFKRDELKKVADFKIPEEFQNKLNENNPLKTAFEALTPGRQRAYLLHFSAPKQSKTRQSRIEKCMPKILNGKGLTD